MRNILKNRFALSTVVTTLIILVVAVLLAGVTTYYAINVTSVRVQEESLAVINLHVWYDAQNVASEAAFIVVNTGGRDVVINKVAVRGQVPSWDHVSYFEGAFSVESDLEYVNDISDGALTPVSNGLGGYEIFSIGTKALTLSSGNSLLIYIDSPDSVSINDIGLTVAITVYTSQAIFYKETNVQAQIGI
jgi:hypothetical protein